jgi:hypothetical protein
MMFMLDQLVIRNLLSRVASVIVFVPIGGRNGWHMGRHNEILVLQTNPKRTTLHEWANCFVGYKIIRNGQRRIDVNQRWLSGMVRSGLLLSDAQSRADGLSGCLVLHKAEISAPAIECPLLGEERTSNCEAVMSAFDPKRTSGP